MPIRESAAGVKLSETWYYLFQERFGRPGKGNDKGKVEALVKYSRANFLTPVPHAASFDALNAALEARCCARQAERAGRHEQTIGERLIADQAVLRALPELPFEPCDKRPAKVSSTALVRYRMNDYSAPTAYGFRDVLVKGSVDEVAIICGASEIARHRASGLVPWRFSEVALAASDGCLRVPSGLSKAD